MSFLGKISRIKNNIKWAWQRAWRGYDDISVINYDLWFPDVTMQILKDLYCVNQGAWAKPIEERKDENDVFFFSNEAKMNAICEDIKRTHAENRPVLVGTLSVAKSEELGLKRASIVGLPQRSTY